MKEIIAIVMNAMWPNMMHKEDVKDHGTEWKGVKVNEIHSMSKRIIIILVKSQDCNNNEAMERKNNICNIRITIIKDEDQHEVLGFKISTYL